MADGRFAPSPTGDLHLGNLRTALLAWLFARSAGSRLTLRMEDLDPGSIRPEFVDSQQRDLVALGLDWDGAATFQSARLERYHAAIDRLEGIGLTYPCYCTRREVREAASAPHSELEAAYPGTCRALTVERRRHLETEGRRAALRVRGEGTRIAFVDRVCGLFEGAVDDFVIRRNDGTPAYNLAVIVDDLDQRIEEVVRADDLLTSTPRQLHLAALLGAPRPPTYAHVPLALGPGGQRLAKRDGAVTLTDRIALGDTVPRLLARLARSAGLEAPEELAPTELRAYATTVDLSTLTREPWRLRAEDLAGP